MRARRKDGDIRESDGLIVNAEEREDVGLISTVRSDVDEDGAEGIEGLAVAGGDHHAGFPLTSVDDPEVRPVAVDTRGVRRSDECEALAVGFVLEGGDALAERTALAAVVEDGKIRRAPQTE